MNIEKTELDLRDLPESYFESLDTLCKEYTELYTDAADFINSPGDITELWFCHSAFINKMRMAAIKTLKFTADELSVASVNTDSDNDYGEDEINYIGQIQNRALDIINTVDAIQRMYKSAKAIINKQANY